MWENEPQKTQIRDQCQVCDSPHNLGDGYILMRPVGAGLTSQLLRRVRQDPKSVPTEPQHEYNVSLCNLVRFCPPPLFFKKGTVKNKTEVGVDGLCVVGNLPNLCETQESIS